MGGDNAPYEIVKGCVDAVNIKEGFKILLVGDEKQILQILDESSYDEKRIEIKNTTEIITGKDIPTTAIKQKKDSSMVVGMNLLKEKSGNAFLSAGNSGALLTGSLLLVGRIKGVIRPALGAVIPSRKNDVLIIDAGLNSECRPESYVQFAKFGSQFYKCMYNVNKPTVGLINIGSEDKKGTPEVKEAHILLKKAAINYKGNIEGNDIPAGEVQVVVCNGFIGNILLKFLEGTAKFMFNGVKEAIKTNFFSKIGGLLIMKPLRNFAKRADADTVGGAPVLGINGLVIKSHGNSKAKTIKNVLIKTITLIEKDIVNQIRLSIQGDINE
ncbi:MAG: phosphate acyltransferase PlsX [Clostridiales bacterium]|nr:phosphate acyltransferase PlsX [Clostridiales bacterium]